MSGDYDWLCPCCGERVGYNDESYYADELDDTVCFACIVEIEGEKDMYDTKAMAGVCGE